MIARKFGAPVRIGGELQCFWACSYVLREYGADEHARGEEDAPIAIEMKASEALCFIRAEHLATCHKSLFPSELARVRAIEVDFIAQGRGVDKAPDNPIRRRGAHDRYLRLSRID